MKHLRLKDIAPIVRSKNAGPFELTVDVFFQDQETYLRLRDAQFLSAQDVRNMYRLSPDTEVKIHYCDPAFALKVTFARDIPSGSPGDRDVYGAQQHAPLAEWEIDARLVMLE